MMKEKKTFLIMEISANSWKACPYAFFFFTVVLALLEYEHM